MATLIEKIASDDVVDAAYLFNQYNTTIPTRMPNVDYFIPTPQNPVIIEAKNADLGKGFTWKFGLFHR